MHKKESQGGLIAGGFIMLIAIIAVGFYLTDDTATAGVTYNGGYSCTANGATYQSCVWIRLSAGETAITHVPWMAKTFTGLTDQIAQRSSGATPQIRAWTQLTNWLNEKIYDSTPKALRNLALYSKKKSPNTGKTVILVGTNIKNMKDSWWPGWKWVELQYDFYWEDDNRQMRKYASDSQGFYYHPGTGEIKH